MDPAKIRESNDKLKSKMTDVAEDQAAKDKLAEARAGMAKAAAEFSEFRKAADEGAAQAKLEEDLAKYRKVAHGSFPTKIRAARFVRLG
ncbi:hypothetical protein RvY_00832 [Ramazzottius varieornatus]|uniref:Uncharacterized protein n=1 Tax=Ramazzottius varieornatus TaxID=947166 RepID=A0A1D1UPI3_RAMVA|nr:hypothetical protein RvY_00832 [Ramazzottius varieornatus]